MCCVCILIILKQGHRGLVYTTLKIFYLKNKIFIHYYLKNLRKIGKKEEYKSHTFFWSFIVKCKYIYKTFLQKPLLHRT